MFEHITFSLTLGMFRYMFFLQLYKVKKKIVGNDLKKTTFPQNDPQIWEGRP